MAGSWVGRFWRRRSGGHGADESPNGPPEFTPEQADEIRGLLDQLGAEDSEERRRLRRHLRGRGFYIGSFPDVNHWSARTFARLAAEGRVAVRRSGEDARRSPTGGSQVGANTMCGDHG